MKKAVIYVFSGTGNTYRIARLYKSAFDSDGVDTRLYNIKTDFSDAPDPNLYDYVGIAYPIHAFNAPSIVLDFIKSLPDAQRNSAELKPFFVIKSSGEPLSLNNISSILLSSKMKRKGYGLSSEYHYAMPYNMIFRHSENMAYEMLETAKRLCPIDALEVLEGKPHLLRQPPLGRLAAFIFRIEHHAMKINGKYFKADAHKCVGCGKCVASCPTNNIKVENGKIVFGNDCVCCVRCSFDCPQNAIDIGVLNGWKVNGRYSFKPSETEKETHKGYCKRAYQRYFRQAEAKIYGNLSADAL